MQSDRPASQFDRPEQYPRDNYLQPHPSREQRPSSVFQSRHHSNNNTKKPSRAAVPFNRLQLAAALIEYTDENADNETSRIDWSLQELVSQPLLSHKQAPYSAIFIPFRQTLPSKPLDFFTGLELPASPKSAGLKSMSGFGIVSETGASRLPTTIQGLSRRTSQPVVIEDALATGSRSDINPVDNDVEVLSEWGLDKLLSGNLETPKSSEVAQEVKALPRQELSTDRAPENLENRRQQVQSDMFDFHFSELRLYNDQEEEKLGKSFTPDFFDDQKNNDELNAVIDDEALLRQRVGCDPEGRKLLRPQSVMELQGTHQRYLQNKTSTAKQLAVLRGRAPLVAQQGFAVVRPKKSATFRPKSLSPTRAVARASMSALSPTISKLHPTRQRSVSGAIDTLQAPSSDLPLVRGRRKSVLDEPSNRRFSFNPLQGARVKRLHQRGRSTTSIANPSLPEAELVREKKLSMGSDLVTESAAGANPNPILEPKSKGRTSTDIAERYQKSIAMLEGRKSEDMTYDVPNKLSSSLGGSQRDQDGTSRDHQTNAISQLGSSLDDQQESEFSLGAPRTFTSRFDPKVASVLSQAKPTSSSLQDDSENRSLVDAGEDGDGGENGPEISDHKDSAADDAHIYDEHGRIRFPASLKPLVLIMPIPLTPAQPEPEEAEEPDLEMTAAEEAAQAEKAKLEEIQKLKNVRPAGKLYGRSLIDELNSRKGNQKSKQMAFGANHSGQNFNQHLSPEDASRPGSIYSMADNAPQVRLMLPQSTSSPMHLANQARQTTQSKFSQALINSSKARKSVFGMDMVMKAELEKLKRIKAIEEQELREEESKIEAKEAKKQARRKGKKKGGEEEAMKNDDSKHRISHRLSRLDNWDALLEKETQPPPIPETRVPIPLPVLMSPMGQSENLSGNMSDWFKDKGNESSVGHTPAMPPSLDLDDGFEHADTLARRLELQVEEMNYKPLPNLFESHHMVRPNSVQSQAAFLSRGTRGNTPNPLMANMHAPGGEDHNEGEELLRNSISEDNRQSSMPQSLLHPNAEQDDNVPLSHRRKSNFLNADVDPEEDDNRPLSQIGTKLAAGPGLSLTRSHMRPASPHDSDEELPLGIRASILLSKKHPPIDLTHDGSSSEGPIGSAASDESDMIPLGLRASAFLPIPSEAVRPSGISASSHDDDVPLAYRASRMPAGAHAFQGQHLRPIGTLASSGKSIGGQSDDIPLGVKMHDPRRPTTLNPTFFFSSQAATTNNPYQNAAPQGFPKPISDEHPKITTIGDDDEDEEDDVPLAQRSSALPPAVSANSKDSLKEPGKGPTTGQTIVVTPSESESPRYALPDAPVSQKREHIKMRSPIPSQVIDETVAREDTLAALEGRGNLEAHADDDVPLGVARAAHSTTGSIHRQRTIKRQKDRERNLEAARAKAELEALMQARKTPVDGKAVEAEAQPNAPEEKDKDDDDDDDDDVPLGMNAHASMMNLRGKGGGDDDEEEDDVPLGISRHKTMMNPQEAMMQKLLEQQNAAFGFPLGGANHHHMSLPNPFNNPMSSMMMLPPNPYLSSPAGPQLVPSNPAPFFPPQLGYQPQFQQQQQQQQQAPISSDGGVAQDATISRWRQDVE
ncbi:hypothetical protein PCANC_12554 [Puccinia coronata f. sp. avenae]|uniref:Uncharacterized protein n=1 Tax=Puccinia coronata f. sp. avenae TaxID=200324 RepID=A0A2N5SZM1_9BASI|nr:hypothetical protein PCANC_12554 [Puccinia coronata f. sp. avenae]